MLKSIRVNVKRYSLIRDVVGRAGLRGAQTPGGGFFEHRNQLWGIFEAPKAPRKLEITTFSKKKSIF